MAQSRAGKLLSELLSVLRAAGQTQTADKAASGQTASDNTAAPEKDGYASWLKQYGTDAAKVYADAARAADGTYARSGSRYGARGESLGRSGLTGSGYGDYLDGVARSDRAKALEDATAAGEAAAEGNRRGYAEYLVKQGTRRKSILSSIRGQGITDPEVATAYAAACGMNETDAALVGSLVGQMRESGSGVSVHQKVKVMQYMVNIGMPRETAYVYALSCGMTESEAREMAEAAEAAVNAKNRNQIHYN